MRRGRAEPRIDILIRNAAIVYDSERIRSLQIRLVQDVRSEIEKRRCCAGNRTPDPSDTGDSGSKRYDQANGGYDRESFMLREQSPHDSKHSGRETTPGEPGGHGFH